VTDPALPLAGAENPASDRRVEPALGAVPLMDPRRVYDDWGPEAEQVLVRILRDHTYVKGPEVHAFEEEFASYVGVRRAVAVDSCTDALFLVLRAILEGRPADKREVILPPFTFVATAGAVVNAGGTPVFADVDPDTMNIDPASVKRLVGEKTAVVIPVHLFGSPADMDALRASTEGYDVALLEDAAQAVHATLGGKRVGALGDVGTFSFYPSKNLGAAGDGGMVTTDDEHLADLVAALRDHGQTRKLYDHARVGTNSRMDEMQAAVLRIKLPYIGAWTLQRRAVAARYDFAFQGTPVHGQHILPDAQSAYHLYTVRVQDRNALREALSERGIKTGVYYPVPLHRQTCFAGGPLAVCPGADLLAGEVISLPCFPGMTVEEQDFVIHAVHEVAGT
jgi:dTDP-4-amino-4,6-dideoxygalactose transaminase